MRRSFTPDDSLVACDSSLFHWVYFIRCIKLLGEVVNVWIFHRESLSGLMNL